MDLDILPPRINPKPRYVRPVRVAPIAFDLERDIDQRAQPPPCAL